MPIRTCVSCRKKAEKNDLVRFVAVEGGEGGKRKLRGDLEQKLPGRGAYCHPAPGCLGHDRLLSALTFSIRRAAKGRGEEKPNRIVVGAEGGKEVLELIVEMLSTKPRKQRMLGRWEQLSDVQAKWSVDVRTHENPNIPRMLRGTKSGRGRVRM